MISKDLIHWQRLPPPIQSFPGDHAVWGGTGERTFDGSISMLPAEDGGPIILYDAPDRIPKGYPGCGECILSIARLNKTDDKYLQLFTRDEGGGDPVNLTGQNMTKGAHNGPVDFPSTIWKNGAPPLSQSTVFIDGLNLWRVCGHRRPLEFYRARRPLHDQGQVIPEVDARGTRLRRLPREWRSMVDTNAQSNRRDTTARWLSELACQLWWRQYIPHWQLLSIERVVCLGWPLSHAA